MNYRVDWNAVRSELDRILEEAPDPAAILRAVLRLDAALGYCPERTSESREGNSRIAIEPPLVATLRVDETASKVHVSRLRFYERPEIK